MKKLLLAAAALTAFLAGPALATDLSPPPPVQPVYKSPPPLAIFFTWTGCYVGGNGGGLWAHNDWSDPVFGGAFGSHTTSGGLGGVQAGCNYQRGSWVFGVQADYDWASATGSNPNGAFPLVTDQSRIKSLISLTGRTGFAVDRFWGYVKGGGAWLQSDYSVQLAGATIATASARRDGWTIGIGGEYAFLNWLTAFIEYDYYNFRANANSFACIACGFLVANVTTNVNVVKAGLNFKFGPNMQ